MRRKKKIGQKYFDREYWEDGTKSGYNCVDDRRDSYINDAKALFLTTLYGTEGKWLLAGCAFGWVVESLAKLGVDAHGFDISKHAVRNAPKEISWRIKCSDGLTASLYSPDEFDVIVSMETAEHVPQDNASSWLFNLFAWLEPGGRMFLTICLGHDNIRGLDDNDKSHQTLQPREWWESIILGFGAMWDTTSFNAAHNIVVETEQMKGLGGPANMVEHYDMNVFTYVK